MNYCQGRASKIVGVFARMHTLIQICNSEDVRILKGVVSKDHIHMHIEYRPSIGISYLVKKLKGRSSRKLQQEFPVLKSNIGVVIFGQ